MFSVGFARLDITPPLGSPLAGYEKPRPAKTVLDPLELNALAFSDGENRAVLVVSDFLYVMEESATRIRKLISERCGLSEDCIFLHSLHQHTSVRIGKKVHLDNIGIADEGYLSVLFRKFCDVSALALADLAPAKIEVGEKEVPEKLSFVRRYRMKDGSVRTNPGVGNPKVVCSVGEADNTAKLVKFEREGKEDIALISFSTHSDVVSGEGISADWPGFIRRTAEKEREGIFCVALCGPQGDTNHVDVLGTLRTGYGHAKYMGEMIARTALSLWNETKPLNAGKVFGKVEMKYIPTNTKGLEKLSEYEEMKRKIEKGELDLSRDMGMSADLERVLNLSKETLYQNVPVSVLCLGGLCFAGFGGEAFTDYGRKVSSAFPDKYILTACLVNGGQGYLPTKEAYDEGGYEANSSRFSSSLPETVIGCAVDLIKGYDEK